MSFETVLRRLAHLIEDYEASALSRLEVTRGQLRYLDAVRELENPTVGEVAQQVKVARPTATIGIEGLTNAGFLRKVRSDADRRSSHVHLTQAGEAVCRRHDSAHQEIEERFRSRLTGDEVDELSRLLKRVIDSD